MADFKVLCTEWDQLVGLVVEQDVQGYLVVDDRGDGWGRAEFAVRPGLPPDVFDTIADWAMSRVVRFLEHGPEPDGWGNEPDGVWRLWCRLYDMPPLD